MAGALRDLLTQGWQVCLAVFAVGTTVYFLLGSQPVAQACIFVGANALMVAAVSYAALHVRGHDRAIWGLLAAGEALAVVANVLWYLAPASGWTQSRFPSFSDVLYLGSYAILSAALAWMALQRIGDHGLAPALDAGIVTTGLAGLAYVLLVAPILGDHDSTGLATLTAIAYPVSDLAIFGLVAWLAGAGGLRAPAVRLLVGFAGAQLVADAWFVRVSAADSFHFGDAYFAGWLIAYGLMAAAALHPSRASLGSPVPRAQPGGRQRLPLIAVGITSTLIPAMLLVTQLTQSNDTTDEIVLVSLSVLMFLLIVLRMAQMLGALARSERAIRHQALHDALTGLPNRALLLDRAQQALARSVRSGRPVSLLMMDVDGFKQVNDGLGHEIGDQVLRHVGATLLDCVRPADTAARWGGDEFTVLLDEADDTVASTVAARILDALMRPVVYEGRELVILASIGVASAVGGVTTQSALFRNADVAMYGAKAHGKGCFELFQPYMHAEVIEAIELQVELERALHDDELIVQYQPIVKLSSGELVGVEALVRWQHPERGLIFPNAFIALAEQTGIIVPLGQAVLRKACADVSRWRRDFPAAAHLKLSVNLSGRQLRSPALCSQVLETLSAAGLEPECLIVDVTERLLLDESASAAATLAALRQAGVTVAIDNFGTGYSSLGYLRNLPVDMVKIDGAFVANVSSSDDHAFVQSVLHMIKTLGLESVAEGVETRQQADAMAEMGCDEAQGFYFARPLDATAVNSLLAEVAPRLETRASSRSRAG